MLVKYYLHMLKIFNGLRPFIEDCYREIGIREYSRIIKVTPPTASRILKNFESEQILKKKMGQKIFAIQSKQAKRDIERIIKVILEASS